MGKYYIYFQKSNINRWYSIFLNKKISHVGLITIQNNNVERYLIINRYTENQSVSTAHILHSNECSLLDKYHSILNFTNLILFENLKIKNNKILAFFDIFAIFNCVSLVKSYLGIKNVFIITPYQLYKYLLKQGGKEVWQ